VTRRQRRKVLGAAAAVLIAVVAILLAVPPPVRAERYSVYDGDTLEILDNNCLLAHFHLTCPAQRLRLYGVDAFERSQACRDAEGKKWECGAVATARLKELVDTPDFHCQVDKQFVDRHAREFAACTAGDRDVGATLVAEGLAFAYGRRTRYVAIEATAKAEHRGAWAGNFVRPQYFRAGARD